MVKYRFVRTVFVGLDYHQSVVQVCILDRTGAVLVNRACENEAAKIATLVGRYGSRVEAAIEACTGAADLADELVALGWSVSLAHPGYVARIKQSPDKSDFSDARLLADLVRVGYLPKVWLAPEAIRELRRLVRYRQQLAEERRSKKLRVSALLRELRLRAAGRTWTKAWRAWLLGEAVLSEQSRWVIERLVAGIDQLQRELEEVEQRLEQITADDRQVQALRALSGIGPITAVTLRAEIGHFDRFRTGKQLARFCGLSPRNASSGMRQADAGLIKAGNPELRRVLIQAAHRLRNHDERWHALAQRLKAAGKPPCVIIAAVANRWVRWLHHRMIDVATADQAA